MHGVLITFTLSGMLPWLSSGVTSGCLLYVVWHTSINLKQKMMSQWLPLQVMEEGELPLLHQWGGLYARCLVGNRGSRDWYWWRERKKKDGEGEENRVMTNIALEKESLRERGETNIRKGRERVGELEEGNIILHMYIRCCWSYIQSLLSN